MNIWWEVPVILTERDPADSEYKTKNIA
jgi:hypothetical protein